jgi:trimethylamine---corrinoid protein Co-methyltransferase
MVSTGGQYRPFSDGDVRKIHQAVVTLLEKGGVKVFTRAGREYFKRAGASLDDSSNIVRIPRRMLEDAIASAPRTVTLCGRDPRHDIDLEGTNVYLGTGGTAINVLDIDSGARRPSTCADVRNMARLVDACDWVHFFLINVYPNDIEDPEQVDLNRFYDAISNTSKHVQGGMYGSRGLREVVDMAEMIAGGPEQLRARPFVSFITLIISPFKIDDRYGDFTCYLAERGLPVVVPTEPLGGLTSPVTLAANVVMHTAETLAGVVLTQVVNTGTPVICGSVGSIADMRTLAHLGGSIERAMIHAGCSQMAQHYQLPYYSTAGMSDSKLVDCQAGYESGMGSLLVALSGANFIHDAAGLMEFDLTASYEKVVVDNEILARTHRVLRGIEVTDDTIALDLMLEVGPGGDYLGQEHTVRHMRSEFAPATISDRERREDWEAAGAKDTYLRAKEEAKRILREHQPLPLDPRIVATLRQKYAHFRG